MTQKLSALDDIEGYWQPVRSAILATAGLHVLVIYLHALSIACYTEPSINYSRDVCRCCLFTCLSHADTLFKRSQSTRGRKLQFFDRHCKLCWYFWQI